MVPGIVYDISSEAILNRRGIPGGIAVVKPDHLR